MATQTQSRPGGWTGRRGAVLGGLLLIHFGAAYLVGSQEWLRNDGGYLLPPIAVTVALPVLAFLAAYGASRRFRGFVLAQDARALAMVQLWRVVGFLFLPLYAFGVLPALFAWPAALGDVAIGFGALYVALRLLRRPEDAGAPAVRRLHLLGLLDFVLAVATAALTAGRIPALVPDGVTSAPLDVWPLSLFPSFIVPWFIILHATALLGLRAVRRADAAADAGAAQPA